MFRELRVVGRSCFYGIEVGRILGFGRKFVGLVYEKVVFLDVVYLIWEMWFFMLFVFKWILV